MVRCKKQNKNHSFQLDTRPIISLDRDAMTYADTPRGQLTQGLDPFSWVNTPRLREFTLFHASEKISQLCVDIGFLHKNTGTGQISAET